MKIFINSGHGGKDPGAVSKSGNKEADITAKVADILVKRLILNGYPVEFYQQKNYLTEVSKKENKSGATLFISIHCNSFSNPKSHGIETLFYKGSAKGLKIAEIFQEELVKATGLYNRGVKPRSDLHVLKATKAPAVLVELAFLSNPEEEKLLIEKPEIFANALWEGVKKLKANKLL